MCSWFSVCARVCEFNYVQLAYNFGDICALKSWGEYVRVYVSEHVRE